MAQDLKRKDIPISSMANKSVVVPQNFGTALSDVMKSHTGRHWRTLITAMGEQKIPATALTEIKQYAPEFMQLLENDDVTLAELVLLQQYAKAIKEGDTKAATFLRDTAGMAPIKEVSMSVEQKGLQSLSDEELRTLLDAIMDVQVPDDSNEPTESVETSPSDDAADSVAYGLKYFVDAQGETDND